jgi:SAM-dependent methyltransferase
VVDGVSGGQMAGRPGSLRRCPECGAISPILPQENLWPPSWACRACGHILSRSDGFPLLSPSLDQVNEGFDLENFSLLTAVEERSFWFRSRNELIRWLVQRYASHAQRALEVGCGTGYALSALREALPNARIAGSELHSRGLVAARARHGNDFELLQLDARDCHLVEALDLVGAFDVLEHVPEDELVLAEIRRILKPGGVLVATVPQHSWMWSTADDVALHQRRYRRGELARKAKAAGLQPLYISSFTTLSFPIMVVSRVLERMRSRKLSLIELSANQFHISPLSNGLLLGLARLEHLLRRAGVPLPFGGSQVLVAKRSDDGVEDNRT